MPDLTDQVAIVTGASRGLGAYVAARLARAGLRVALAARNEADLHRVADAIRSDGGTALVHAFDLRDHDARDAFVARVQDEFGPVDVLINNAGLSWYKPLTDWTREEIDTVLDVNLKSLIHMTHAVLPSMIERQRGQIINVASDIGRRVIPNMAAYVAAKHGVVGFSGSVLREVKQHGIRVSVLLPGVIDTYFGGAQPGERDAEWSMPSEHVAETIYTMLTQPGNLILDEVTVHPLGQDF